jgi:hypothetical protein
MKIILAVMLLLPISLNAQNQNDSVMISLHRTLCYGGCPAYSVTIWGSGNVEFIGSIGKKTYSISSKSVDSLVQRILAIDFFSFDDSYTVKRTFIHRPDGGIDTSITMASDLPTQYVTVQLGNRKKTVEDYYGGPSGLYELEREIDVVARTSQWFYGK